MSSSDPIPDPATLRAEVVAAVGELGGAPNWLFADDPAFDTCIASAMPRGAHRDIVQSAQACAGQALMSAEGCARITQRMEARYAAPVVTRAGADVTIDVGAIPGPVSFYRGKLLVGTESTHLDRWQWATTEVLNALRLGMQREPGAERYQAIALVFESSGRPRWTYTYEPARQRIVVAGADRQDDVYILEPVDPTFASVRSLHTLDLHATDLRKGD